MAKKSTSKTSQKTPKAIREIKQAFRLGKSLLKEFPETSYDSGNVKKAADKHGISTDTVRKRRALAVYFGTSEALEKFCQRLRKKDRAMGVSLLDRVLSAPDPASRRKLLTRVINEGLSRQQIDRIIKDQFGTRRQGGKLPQIKTAEDFLADLEKTCITCHRLCERGLSEQGEIIEELPETLQHQIKSVNHLSQAMIAGIKAHRKLRKPKQ